MEISVLVISAFFVITTWVCCIQDRQETPYKPTRNLSEACPLEFNVVEFDYKDPI